MKFKGQQRTIEQTVLLCFRVPAQEQEESPAILVGMIWVFSQERVQMQFPQHSS